MTATIPGADTIDSGRLRQLREADPDIRILGIEWANKYANYCADRVSRAGLTNARVMRTDAQYFVIHHLPPDCLAASIAFASIRIASFFHFL